MRGGESVPTPDDQEWITIDEAKRLTGKSRATLMRLSAKRLVETRTVEQPFTQPQKRILFRKSELIPPDRDAV